MNSNDIISQIEMNKTNIQRYFDAYIGDDADAELSPVCHSLLTLELTSFKPLIAIVS